MSRNRREKYLSNYCNCPLHRDDICSYACNGKVLLRDIISHLEDGGYSSKLIMKFMIKTCERTLNDIVDTRISTTTTPVISNKKSYSTDVIEKAYSFEHELQRDVEGYSFIPSVASTDSTNNELRSLRYECHPNTTSRTEAIELRKNSDLDLERSHQVLSPTAVAAIQTQVSDTLHAVLQTHKEEVLRLRGFKREKVAGEEGLQQCERDLAADEKGVVEQACGSVNNIRVPQSTMEGSSVCGNKSKWMSFHLPDDFWRGIVIVTIAVAFIAMIIPPILEMYSDYFIEDFFKRRRESNWLKYMEQTIPDDFSDFLQPKGPFKNMEELTLAMEQTRNKEVIYPPLMVNGSFNEETMPVIHETYDPTGGYRELC